MILDKARTILSVPGHIQKMHTKAFLSGADMLQFDLEDSVPESEKRNAMQIISETLNSSWELNKNNAAIGIRLCPPDSVFFQEVIFWFFKNEIYKHVDFICMPKVEDAFSVKFFDKLIRKNERDNHVNINVQLSLTIESPLAFENINEIATASEHVTSLVFGIADYTRAMNMELSGTSGHGENDQSEFGYRFGWQLSRLANCAKAHGLMAIDAPYGDIKDAEGLRRSAERAKFFGMDGKWVIHPSQIEIVNEVFSPSKEKIENAQKVIEAFESSGDNLPGAIAIDGKMVDIATYNLAKHFLKTYGY
jgi:citrate lyase beta subunit